MKVEDQMNLQDLKVQLKGQIEVCIAKVRTKVMG